MIWVRYELRKRIGKKKEDKSNIQSKAPEFYVKNPNRKNHGPTCKSTILLERLHGKNRENLTAALYLQ